MVEGGSGLGGTSPRSNIEPFDAFLAFSLQSASFTAAAAVLGATSWMGPSRKPTNRPPWSGGSDDAGS